MSSLKENKMIDAIINISITFMIIWNIQNKTEFQLQQRHKRMKCQQWKKLAEIAVNSRVVEHFNLLITW